MESILKQPTTNTLGSILSAYPIWISFVVLAPVIVFGCTQCNKKHKAIRKRNNDVEKGLSEGPLLGENQQPKEENVCSSVSEKLKEENEQLQEENEKLKGENEKLKGEKEQLKGENEKLKGENGQLKEENKFLGVRFYRVDLTLDPKTAHPRLAVSEDGKSVKDTGNIHDVSTSKERFESHTFVLAKQLFSEGRYYWEVEVGQKDMWDLGVASESALRTGKITLSPQNGYWIIGRDDGKDYWARTDPWTCLNIPRKPTRIGIFLNMKSHEISFYDAPREHKLYTFLNVASGKFYPFFSTGSVRRREFDHGTVRIPSWFEDEKVVEENEINN